MPRSIWLGRLGAAAVVLVPIGITLTSLNLRPCHSLDRALGLSGCQRVMTVDHLLDDLAVSPDGLTVAAASDSLTVWSSASGSQLAALPDTADVEAVAFSPDGALLAVGGHAQAVELRTPETGAVLGTLQATGDVKTLAFSPDGALLAAGSDTGLQLWRVADRALLHEEPIGGGIYTLAFAPDGRTLATGGFDHDVTLWSVPELTQRHQFKSQTAYDLAFSPDGALLAAAQYNEVVSVWRLADRALVWSFTDGHQYESANSVRYSPDGQHLVAALDTGEVRVWRTADNAPEATLRLNRPVISLRFARDGHTVAFGVDDNTIRVWRWPIGGQPE